MIYEYQEGRGIGLMAKLEAYELQDVGLDTVEANHALGFKADCRDFSLPAAILRDLGIKRVRLLSNNPRKASALAEHGIGAVRAAELGLVTRVVPDKQLLATAMEIAKKLAAKPGGALRASKRSSSRVSSTRSRRQSRSKAESSVSGSAQRRQGSVHGVSREASAQFHPYGDPGCGRIGLLERGRGTPGHRTRNSDTEGQDHDRASGHKEQERQSGTDPLGPVVSSRPERRTASTR